MPAVEEAGQSAKLGARAARRTSVGSAERRTGKVWGGQRWSQRERQLECGQQVSAEVARAKSAREQHETPKNRDDATQQDVELYGLRQRWAAPLHVKAAVVRELSALVAQFGSYQVTRQHQRSGK